ncbi:peroxisomal biogenesis factor 6 [Nannizzia gypsea CBS 118893]|uniref:Peroxisomal ATPase PEX6 n=1 Tax=Arthroderma gypseum (strain ATCC MYA-4604 / CBS 118893) TaxID=535722 RepID=E4UYK5_ARTGP|nr:peroxisomal biogenesis factor 6 [Nannizzia gypsea CBS 118893]EFR02168.1 peroxisomal biogenesis factor 6 [Nannizzia gypsea CBS 118893]
MASNGPLVAADDHQHRRRKGALRQRKTNKGPISSRLMLDIRLKGEVGILSDELLADLFPRQGSHDAEAHSEIIYVALAPWMPNLTTVEDVQWTIVPVRTQASEKTKASFISSSAIHFPVAANSIQPFIQALQGSDPSRSSFLLAQRGIEIHIVNVTPLHLDTIYVTVERNLLRDIDEIQGKFGGGFSGKSRVSNGLWPKGKGSTSSHDRAVSKGAKQSAAQRDERLMEAIRRGLAERDILHSGDLIPLPLPSHPITHAPPPPAMITFCEPVAQGRLMPKTKIILLQARSARKQHTKSLSTASTTHLKRVTEIDTEDTLNDTFYSAGEEKGLEEGTDEGTDGESPSPPDESDTEASTESHSDADDSDDSDDSLEDMISLAAPELPQQTSGAMSAFSSATPRLGGRSLGIHSPGSVFSSFTSNTARQGRQAGKTFKAECLIDRIPNELLHPKPREEDDTDAFIFVDVHTLVKIGCFSGDWVRVAPTEEPQRNMLSSLAFSGLNGLMGSTEEPENWRVARVYGVTGLSPPKIRYSMNKSAERSSSISQVPPHGLTPTVLLPPLLLHNLQSPSYVKLSPLSLGPAQHGPSKLGLAASRGTGVPKAPPTAKEVTLLKISTPLSVDRALQPAIFSALKHHFESKRRLVKGGDMIGVSIDEGLGRTVFSATKSADVTGQEDELPSQLAFSSGKHSPSSKVGVAWFRVSHVTAPTTSAEPDSGPDHELWGGVAAIDTLNTRMVQAGSEIGTIPGTLRNTWEYWLSVKAAPQLSVDQKATPWLQTDSPAVFISPIQRRVRELVAAATSPRAIQLGLKPVVILLTSTQRNIGKSTVARRACADIGLHTFTIDSYDILSEGGANGGDMKTEAYLKARADRAFACGSACTALLIEHIEVLTADRIVTSFKEIVASSRVIIATTTDVEKVPEGIRSLFTHELEMTAPEEKEREGILRNAVADLALRISPNVDLASVAVKTAALVAGDLVDVVERAVAERTLRLEKLADSAAPLDAKSTVSVRDVQIAGGDATRSVTKADFDAAVDAARKNFADSIGAPKIPNVTWDDVGGLSNVKDAVMETIQLPLERPELFAKGMKKRSGILFYGPPGTGKTLLAKAIATEFSLNFFSVKGPELLNMYIGESEANVRRVFQRARDARPCVVFFDELDSVAPKRGNQGDSGGVMDRIVSQLLAELDGMSGGDENGGGVFVIGATNRPDLLDAALLRPGRFDKMLYLGVSDTHDKQLTILEALTRKFNLHPDLSLKRVSELLPFTYTGADLYALCSDAMLKAITRQANAVDERIKALPSGPVTTAYFFDHLATPEDTAVMVTEQDFLEAKNELVPSVSAKELEHFERVRKTFETVDTKKSSLSDGEKAIEEGPADGIDITADGSLTIGEALNASNKPAGDTEADDEYIVRTDHLANAESSK